MNRVLLSEAGIDYNKGVERFMDNSAVYERLLKNFPKENKYEEAFSLYEKKDFDGMFRCLHTMKSTAGTLDLTSLFEVTCELVEILRAKQYNEVPPYLETVTEYYHKAVAAIENP